MKKLALTAFAAIVAVTGLASTASTASADSRNNDEWRRYSDRDGGDRARDRDRERGDRADRGRDRWDDRRDDRREARRDRGRDEDWRWRGGRRDHWRPNYNPRFVFRYDRADYCFVKKVRRYDDWGNVYIKRVRVCR